MIVDHVGTASSHSCRTEQSDKSTGPVFCHDIVIMKNEKYQLTNPQGLFSVHLSSYVDVIM